MAHPGSTSSSVLEPKYVSYAAHLRRQIESGELKPGDRLPSRAETRALHQITQPTIERAQALLEREGLIVRRERQGIFVADTTPRPRSSEHRVSSRLTAQTVALLTNNEGRIHPGHYLPGWSDYITQGALSACASGGKHTLILNPLRLGPEELDHLLEQPPLGFVVASLLTPAQEAAVAKLVLRFRRESIPVVVFSSEARYTGVDRVQSDHKLGNYLLTRHLIGRGCRRILPFWPPVQEHNSWLLARYEGYLQAMEEAGLEPLPIAEIPENHSPAEPDDTIEKFNATARYRAGYLAEHVLSPNPVDAVMEVSDGNCLSLAQALRLLGREPNRDILIAGYDNIWRDASEVAFMPIPPVATVDKDNWEIGHSLVRLLLERAAGELPSEPQMRLVPPRLVELSTSGSHPDQAYQPNGRFPAEVLR